MSGNAIPNSTDEVVKVLGKRMRPEDAKSAELEFIFTRRDDESVLDFERRIGSEIIDHSTEAMLRGEVFAYFPRGKSWPEKPRDGFQRPRFAIINHKPEGDTQG